KEMVHRYFASALGLLIVVLAGIALANRKDPRQPVALPLALVGIVILQGLLGMWTVTLLLKPLIVVLHLLGGLLTLALLAWLVYQPRSVPEQHGGEQLERTLRVRNVAIAGLAVLVLQIALGGWTSSNYAALACPDFPQCQKAWWPEMNYKDAFVLWRGLGIDYEGGVLDHPARVAIHFTHRLGAIVAAILLGFLSILASKRGLSAAIRATGALLGIALVVQLVLGPLMVMRGLPLSLATAHNGVAALLLICVVLLLKTAVVETAARPRSVAA